MGWEGRGVVQMHPGSTESAHTHSPDLAGSWLLSAPPTPPHTLHPHPYSGLTEGALNTQHPRHLDRRPLILGGRDQKPSTLNHKPRHHPHIKRVDPSPTPTPTPAPYLRPPLSLRHAPLRHAPRVHGGVPRCRRLVAQLRHPPLQGRSLGLGSGEAHMGAHGHMAHMGAHGRTLVHMGAHGHTWAHMGTRGHISERTSAHRCTLFLRSCKPTPRALHNPP